MGIAPSEAKALTLAEYQGLLHNWNKAQGAAEDAPLEPPTPEELAERRAALEAAGVKVLF